MLSRIFDADNSVFSFIGKIADIWILHILWLVCSLPIITIGASTTALCYSCMKLKKGESYPIKNFFHSFKENFKQSTFLFIIFAGIGIILGVDLIFWNRVGGLVGGIVKIVTFMIICPYMMTLFYVFAVQARFENTIKNTIKNSFYMSIKHFPYTIQMGIIAFVVIYANTTIILANYITVSIGMGLIIYWYAEWYNRVFAFYMPKTQEKLEQTEKTEFEETEDSQIEVNEKFFKDKNTEV